MTWVYISIAIGAAGFLVRVIVEFLNASSRLKPRAELIQQEIRECEFRIEVEQSAIETNKHEVAALQKEISELEKELSAAGTELENHRQRERRRKPTKFRLEES